MCHSFFFCVRWLTCWQIFAIEVGASGKEIDTHSEFSVSSLLSPLAVAHVLSCGAGGADETAIVPGDKDTRRALTFTGSTAQ